MVGGVTVENHLANVQRRVGYAKMICTKGCWDFRWVDIDGSFLSATALELSVQKRSKQP